MTASVVRLAATATSHHFEPLMAATVVNGALARTVPNTANLPKDESGSKSAMLGTNAAAQKRDRHKTPSQPIALLLSLGLIMLSLCRHWDRRFHECQKFRHFNQELVLARACATGFRREEPWCRSFYRRAR